ncbi:hypothetical protein B0H13DRAFT_1865994 [Mycena leptocephala]|nr:hypothetical protein B0H13DRAFT_1865994 [Mycena leptocephala]
MHKGGVELCAEPYGGPRGVSVAPITLSASKIQSNLLAMHSGTWKMHFKNIRAILRSVDQCAKEIKEMRTALLLIIEKERQRKLAEGIKELQEVLGAVICSPIYSTYYRSESDSYLLESYTRCMNPKLTPTGELSIKLQEGA